MNPRLPDPRFVNLGDDEGLNESDEEFLDNILSVIREDLGRDVIVFDEVSVDENEEYDANVVGRLSMQGINHATPTSREMEVTLKYEVPL